MRTIPACMYFSSCSRLCSTSAGVSVKIFFGGKAGTTLLPYSFFICWCKAHVVKVCLQLRQAKLVISLILAALNQRSLIFFHHISMCENQTWPFSWPKHLSPEERWLKWKTWVHFTERYIHELNHRFISGTGLMVRVLSTLNTGMLTHLELSTALTVTTLFFQFLDSFFHFFGSTILKPVNTTMKYTQLRSHDVVMGRPHSICAGPDALSFHCKSNLSLKNLWWALARSVCASAITGALWGHDCSKLSPVESVPY